MELETKVENMHDLIILLTLHYDSPMIMKFIQFLTANPYRKYARLMKPTIASYAGNQYCPSIAKCFERILPTSPIL